MRSSGPNSGFPRYQQDPPLHFLPRRLQPRGNPDYNGFQRNYEPSNLGPEYGARFPSRPSENQYLQRNAMNWPRYGSREQLFPQQPLPFQYPTGHGQSYAHEQQYVTVRVPVYDVHRFPPFAPHVPGHGTVRPPPPYSLHPLPPDASRLQNNNPPYEQQGPVASELIEPTSSISDAIAVIEQHPTIADNAGVRFIPVQKVTPAISRDNTEIDHQKPKKIQKQVVLKAEVCETIEIKDESVSVKCEVSAVAPVLTTDVSTSAQESPQTPVTTLAEFTTSQFMVPAEMPSLDFFPYGPDDSFQEPPDIVVSDMEADTDEDDLETASSPALVQDQAAQTSPSLDDGTITTDTEAEIPMTENSAQDQIAQTSLNLDDGISSTSVEASLVVESLTNALNQLEPVCEDAEEIYEKADTVSVEASPPVEHSRNVLNELETVSRGAEETCEGAATFSVEASPPVEPSRNVLNELETVNRGAEETCEGAATFSIPPETEMSIGIAVGEVVKTTSRRKQRKSRRMRIKHRELQCPDNSNMTKTPQTDIPNEADSEIDDELAAELHLIELKERCLSINPEVWLSRLDASDITIFCPLCNRVFKKTSMLAKHVCPRAVKKSPCSPLEESPTTKLLLLHKPTPACIELSDSEECVSSNTPGRRKRKSASSHKIKTTVLIENPLHEKRRKPDVKSPRPKHSLATLTEKSDNIKRMRETSKLTEGVAPKVCRKSRTENILSLGIKHSSSSRTGLDEPSDISAASSDTSLPAEPRSVVTKPPQAASSTSSAVKASAAPLPKFVNCKSCSFRTTDKKRMRDHQRDRHFRK